MFNTLLISFIPPNADSTHSGAPHAGSTAGRGAAFVEVSSSNAASQHGSTAATTGDADPMKGISTAPIVCGNTAAGFGCMVIQRLYFYSPAVDRDAQRPLGCSAAVSECVGVTAPAKALIISADIMRKGAMANSVAAVCCLTCRLECFNGLGRSLLLMYNLLLILLTLKGKHVARDLTYDGLVGFDVMNTKSSASSSLILLGAGTVGVVLLVTLCHLNLIEFLLGR